MQRTRSEIFLNEEFALKFSRNLMIKLSFTSDYSISSIGIEQHSQWFLMIHQKISVIPITRLNLPFK